MNIIKKTSSKIIALAMIFGAGNVNAALVNFEITGIADYWADAGNVWGLVDNDLITATGTFDDSVLIGGTGTIDFSLSGNSLTIAVGSITYFESDDDKHASGGYPTLSLSGGGIDDLNGFNFFTTLGGNSFESLNNTFFGEDLNLNQINGTWASTVTLSPVPVPAAVWLFGSGLLGLFGVAKRRT